MDAGVEQDDSLAAEKWQKYGDGYARKVLGKAAGRGGVAREQTDGDAVCWLAVIGLRYGNEKGPLFVLKPVTPDPEQILNMPNAFCVFTDEGEAKEYAERCGSELSEARPEALDEGFETLALPVSDVFGLRDATETVWHFGGQVVTHVLLNPTHTSPSRARKNYGGTVYEVGEFENSFFNVSPACKDPYLESRNLQGTRIKHTPRGRPPLTNLVTDVFGRWTRLFVEDRPIPGSRGWVPSQGTAWRSEEQGQRTGSERAYRAKDRRRYTSWDELQWFWDNLLWFCGVILGATGALFCVLALLACAAARNTLDVDASVFSFLGWSLLISVVVAGVSAVFVDWKNRPRSVWER